MHALRLNVIIFIQMCTNVITFTPLHCSYIITFTVLVAEKINILHTYHRVLTNLLCIKFEIAILWFQILPKHLLFLFAYWFVSPLNGQCVANDVIKNQSHNIIELRDLDNVCCHYVTRLTQQWAISSNQNLWYTFKQCQPNVMEIISTRWSQYFTLSNLNYIWQITFQM